MFICQNSEEVNPYLLKCCGGTCSFVGMLKGYIVRKRLGTPVLDLRDSQMQWFQCNLPWQWHTNHQLCKILMQARRAFTCTQEYCSQKFQSNKHRQQQQDGFTRATTKIHFENKQVL